MENQSSVVDNGRSSRRGRFMGKLFGKEKKSHDYPVQPVSTLEAFLQLAPNKLEISYAPPPPPPSSLPKLAKLDTTISRYPQALAVNHQAQQNRPMAPGGPVQSKSPRISARPNKKGTNVHFSDSIPEIIGEGGDESEIPAADIAKRKGAVSSAPPLLCAQPSPSLNSSQFSCPSARQATSLSSNSVLEASVEDLTPGNSSQNTRMGHSSFDGQAGAHTTAFHSLDHSIQRDGTSVGPERDASATIPEISGKRDDKRRSFIEMHQAQMRQAEGKAFAQAARTASLASLYKWKDGAQPPATCVDSSPDPPRHSFPSPESHKKQSSAQRSPAGSTASIASSNYSTYDQSSQPQFPVRQSSVGCQNGLPSSGPREMMSARSSTVRSTDVVDSTGDDALNAFVIGTRHLFELFRLHAETIRPLSRCSIKELARAALWWFLKGRMGLELAIRERPSSPESQMRNELDRQQAYSNLSKGFWLCQEVVPEIADSQKLPLDVEVTEVIQGIMSALRKLSQSMKRNGFLPPEEPFLPSTMDKSIWLDYPTLSQDMIALLSGNWSAGLTAMQHSTSTLQLLDALPISDTPEYFSYGRVMADVFLTEQERETQELYFPCILSMVRPQRSTGLVFMIASQNGAVQLAIQENKKAGPVWDDVRWQNKTCALEVRLPRGFLLVVRLNQNDYRTLWNMYDFSTNVRTMLHPRRDEVVVFRNNLRSFKYLDADAQSRVFPKDAVPQCDVALFESIYKETGPAGPRTWHRGFRIAVVTGPRTRMLDGIQRSFLPSMPVQFGFFRAEGHAPALSLKCVNGQQGGQMLLIFSEDNERVNFHSLLTNTALKHDEKIFSDVPLKSFKISQSMRDPTGIVPFNRIPWSAARVVNDEFNAEGDVPSTVLADKLKIVLEYQNGTISDRVNVAPGELRMRLEVTNPKILRILRQPQQDMTMSVSEAQVPKELPKIMTDALQLLQTSQTIRTYEFNNLKDVHNFQAALMGYEVIFDAIAATFAISRRRMVVPIHKKWEAGHSRIQVVRRRDKQLQLLAFFEDFQHGHCMNFLLKGTDVYEVVQKGGKSGIKFVDAKFPLPGLPADKDGDYDDMAFVCLDVPDLPGEHDDICIMFENDADRDHLSSCLPAPVKGSSRISSRRAK